VNDKKVGFRLKRILRATFYVGPLLLWMVLIFSLSTHAGSMQSTSGLLTAFVQWIAPDLAASLTSTQWLHVEQLLRKAAHLLEYAILMLLSARAFQYGRDNLQMRSVLLGFVLSSLYAVTDEVHQSFIPSRTALAADVLIDIAGVTIAAIFLLFWAAVKSVERRLKTSSRASGRR
jgi:VanZ family protein